MLEVEYSSKYNGLIEKINFLKSSIVALHSKYNEIISNMSEAHNLEIEQKQKLFNLTIQEKEESIKQISITNSKKLKNEFQNDASIGTRLLIETSQHSAVSDKASILLQTLKGKQESLKEEISRMKNSINISLENLNTNYIIIDKIEEKANMATKKVEKADILKKEVPDKNILPSNNNFKVDLEEELDFDIKKKANKKEDSTSKDIKSSKNYYA